MRRKSRKPLTQLSLWGMKTGPASDGSREVILDATIGDATEMSECAKVAVKKRELIAAVIESGEVRAREHKTHKELPDLFGNRVDDDCNLEEIDLSDIAGFVEKRDEEFGLAEPNAAQNIVDCCLADLEAFIQKLLMKKRTGYALLGSSAR